MKMDYIHESPPSLQSRFLEWGMGVLRLKTRLERNLGVPGFTQEPAPLPTSLLKRCNVKTDDQNGRKVWTVSPPGDVSETVLFYLHGGAYVNNITRYHWDLIEALARATPSTLVVPDYPLAPEATFETAYDFIEALYWRWVDKTSAGRIVFIGDSAGAGLALGLAQKLRNEKKTLPSQLIMISPWLDITMSNPEILEVDKKDRMLGIKGLKMAARAYAGDVDLKDWRVSPIYGEFSDLVDISVFVGTHDLSVADARKFKEMMKARNTPINYFEYPGMFHVWIAVTTLKESRHAIGRIARLISGADDLAGGEI